MSLALPFLLGLFLSVVLVPVCRFVAFRLGYIVLPAGDPESAKPKAGFGGVAIFASVLIGAAVMGVFPAVPVLLACSAALLLFGAASDVFSLKPATKVVALTVIASVFLFFDFRLQWTESMTLDSVITLFWIVGVTSAFNLLDNMDGLCAGIALIAGTAFLMTVVPVEPNSLLFARTEYLALLLGALAGFLVFNVHPASVSMGEGGSLVVGLHMAALTLQFARGRGSNLLSVVAVPLLLLMIPIVDATLVAVSRFASETRARTHDHSSHRLVAIGLSERAAVNLLWLLAAVSGLIAVIAENRTTGPAGVLAAMFTIAVALFAVYLARVQVHEDVAPDQLSGAIVPLGIDLGYRRRLVEATLDSLLVTVAYYGAYRLRFEGVEAADNFVYFVRSLPIVLGVQMIALFVVGAYRGMWRYFSLSDALTFAKAVFVGVVTAQAVLLFLYDFQGYTQSVFAVYAMLLFLLLGGSRASFRVITEYLQRRRHTGRRLVVYGAADSGSMTIRHLLHDFQHGYRILGFIDDDWQKQHARVHGYPVLGGHDRLVDMIMAGEVDAVVITHTSGDVHGLERLCRRYGVALYHSRLEWLQLTGPTRVDVPSTAVAETPRAAARAEEQVIRHAFSVDVEDWYHGIPVGREMKEAAAPRLERGLHVLLDLLAERGARATFFILGPLVHKHAPVLRRIAAEGHELGCHGWSHDLVYTMTPERFADDTRQARDAIADLTGRRVTAFRAPYFSITRDSMWALDVLAELGFSYDSSIFPVRNWRYGIEDFSRDPVLVQTQSGPLWEFPISVMERYGQTIPVSGGAYFRLYPYGLTRANFKAQERLGRSVIFYLHPWELDPDHPQVSFAWKPRFTHYANLQSTRPKLVRLLREFSFGSIGDVIAARTA
ncbi:MAG: DUF3473 domain-containing protein [Acidimicrobiia bacterium]|nr:DUF3473 domain-containing protein [Acidimicrobiia bacterium]